MFPSLSQNYKKLILIFILGIASILAIFILKLNLNLVIKAILFLILFLLFLTTLTIFEITSSLVEKIAFWLIISFSLAFFYLIPGLILLVLSLFKIFSQENYLKNLLKTSIRQLISQNYSFLILSFLIIFNFYLYQYLPLQENFPLSLKNYNFIIENLNKIFLFFNLPIPFQEKIETIVQNYLEKSNLPPLITQTFLTNLQDITLKDFLYQNLQKSWQNKEIRKIYISSFLFLEFIILYSLLKFLSFFISLLSLIFYYLYLKIGMIKINYRSVNKEFIEL